MKSCVFRHLCYQFFCCLYSVFTNFDQCDVDSFIFMKLCISSHKVRRGFVENFDEILPQTRTHTHKSKSVTIHNFTTELLRNKEQFLTSVPLHNAPAKTITRNYEALLQFEFELQSTRLYVNYHIYLAALIKCYGTRERVVFVGSFANSACILQ